MDFSIVIPAYDEADGIRPTLEALSAVMAASGIDYEVVVVDDGSTDGTSEKVAELAAELPRVRLLAHARNRGYGAALKTGIRAARAEIVAITDADGTYPNERLPELYRRCIDDQAAMVVGSRTGANVHIPLVRRPAKAFLRALANYLSGNKIPDLNSGLRVMRKEPIVRCFPLVSDGFSFTTTTLLALLARDEPVVFVPIDYHARTGSSKIKPIRDTFNFTVLILRASVYFEPLKVFLPVAAGLVVTGFAWGLGQALAHPDRGIGDAPVLLLASAVQVLLTGLIADMISRRH
ncbi:MAG: glycosyltransferase family 2 protein [Planctomycetes bacterium]|nr:glycosyltransferase family 2 protein [Planctomycetota bacterium]